MDEIRLVENVIFFQELFIELEPKLDVVKVERIDFTEKAELFLRWSNDFELKNRCAIPFLYEVGRG